jgi:hypothetical protein
MRTAVAALDHLVLATPDLAATAAWLEQRTGVRPSAGGQHVGLGTRNMLCSLTASSYLEIIGPDPEQGAVDGPRPFGVDELTEATLRGWAVSVADIDAACTAARRAGHDPGDAVAMQRRRPDGVLLSWRLTPWTSSTTPFLIDWGTSQHPAGTAAGGLVLGELRARHPDPATLSATLRALGVSIGVEHGTEALLVEIRGPLGAISFG